MRLYDSLSRRFKDVPGDKTLSLYACGVTVYDYCHLGHARSYVVWDVLKRRLRRRQRVFHVQNFTDVDDKIVARAGRESVTSKEIAERYIESYFRDMEYLNVLRADLYPRVTEYLIPMKAAATALVESGHAYHKDGDIRFRAEAFEGYGKLSRRKTAEDFVLWKGPKPNEPEFPNGRPGWHLECSVMIERTIGFTVDIHVGGNDLIFPHHENEIAQSECLHCGAPLADIWAHNGMVETGEKKMGKSENNASAIRDYRTSGVDPNVIRYWILSASYTKPLSLETLENGDAARSWAALKEKLKKAPEEGIDPGFELALDDDLNTPVAVAVLHAAPTLEMADVLGFRLLPDEDVPADVRVLADKRDVLRRERRWAEADAVKKEIVGRGYEVRDRADGPSVITKRV
jgi:cysteinyl-tRNA synthetase